MKADGMDTDLVESDEHSDGGCSCGDDVWTYCNNGNCQTPICLQCSNESDEGVLCNNCSGVEDGLDTGALPVST